MSIFINRTGEKHKINKLVSIEIIECFSNTKCTVKFNDGTILHNITYNNILRKSLKNPNHPSVFNIGFLGIGEFKAKNKLTKLKTKEYRFWGAMMQRCYYKDGRQSHYDNCSVVEEWHNFQNFAKWCDDNLIEGYHLDKDILLKGNKIYGPNTCCFVPQEVNNILIIKKSRKDDLPPGVTIKNKKYSAIIRKFKKQIALGVFDEKKDAFEAYKVQKELHIKEVAEIYKNVISEKVYLALINYSVLITD